MAENWTDLTNRFNHGAFGSEQLTALKDHIKEYFIVGQGTEGIANLRLDIIGDETLTVESDVTDHYVESNQAYQDQISLKPKIYTINGEVGELVWYQKDSASQIFGQVAQRLEGVVSFLPIRSRSFNQMKKTVMQAAQWVDTASNAVSKLSNLMSDSFGTVTHQQQAYNELLAMRDGRSPLTIQTPWGILKDYVITSLKLTQPKETKDKSAISITFKEFRTTSVSTVKFDPEKFQRNAGIENQPKVDNGKTEGKDIGIAKIATKDDVSEYAVLREGDEFSVTDNVLCRFDKETDSMDYFKIEETEFSRITKPITDVTEEYLAKDDCAAKIYTQFYME